MASFSDLVGFVTKNPALNPLAAANPDLYKSKEGRPWLQSVHENLKQNTVGRPVADWSNQHLLGQPAPGQMSQPSGTAASVQPQAQPLPDSGNAQVLAFLQKWLQHNNTQQGGM